MARVSVTLALQKLGAEVVLRDAKRKAGPVITDQGNFLLDIRFNEKVDPVVMEAKINNLPGVVENGFFTGPQDRPLRPVIFISHEDGTVERRD
jgi:ribose 5-phosphate isomerase A